MKRIIAIIITLSIIVSFNYPKKERYFFVAWESAGEYGSQSVTSKDGSFINYQETIDYLQKDSAVIIGIYEFKSKSEMEYFWKKK